MSTPMTTTRTNYFRVNDEEAYQKLYRNLFSGNAPIDDLSYFDTKRGIMRHAFGAYGDIMYDDHYAENPENEEDRTFDDDFSIEGFISKLIPLLPDGEVFVLMAAGNEKLNYVYGEMYVATKDEYEYVNLSSSAETTARKLLQNDDFCLSQTFLREPRFAL